MTYKALHTQGLFVSAWCPKAAWCHAARTGRRLVHLPAPLWGHAYAAGQRDRQFPRPPKLTHSAVAGLQSTVTGSDLARHQFAGLRCIPVTKWGLATTPDSLIKSGARRSGWSHCYARI